MIRLSKLNPIIPIMTVIQNFWLGPGALKCHVRQMTKILCSSADIVGVFCLYPGFRLKMHFNAVCSVDNVVGVICETGSDANGAICETGSDPNGATFVKKSMYIFQGLIWVETSWKNLNCYLIKLL